MSKEKSTKEQIENGLIAIRVCEYPQEGESFDPYSIVKAEASAICNLLTRSELLTEEFILCCRLLDIFHTKQLEHYNVLSSGHIQPTLEEKVRLAREIVLFQSKIEALTEIFHAFYKYDCIHWDIAMGPEWDGLEEYCLYHLPPAALKEWLAYDKQVCAFFENSPEMVENFLLSISERQLYRPSRVVYGVILLQYAFSDGLWQLSMTHPGTMSKVFETTELWLSILRNDDFDPHYHNANGRNFMHYAMLYGKSADDISAMFKICPELRPLLNSFDYRRNTPLHHAIDKRRLPGLLGLMRPVLAYEDLDLTLQNADGYTVLMWAIYQENPDIVERLINRAGKRRLEVGVDCVNKFGQTAIDIMLGQRKMGADWKHLREMLRPGYEEYIENPQVQSDIKRKAYHVKRCESLSRLQRIDAKTMALLFEAQGYEQGAVLEDASELIARLPDLREKSKEQDKVVSLDIVIQLMAGHYGVMFFDIDDTTVRIAMFDPMCYHDEMKAWVKEIRNALPENYQCFVYLNTEEIQRDYKSCTIMAMMNALSGRELREEEGLFKRLAEHATLSEDSDVYYVAEYGFPARVYRSVQSTTFFTAEYPLPVLLEEVTPGETLQQHIVNNYFDFSANRQQEVNKFSKRATEGQSALLRPFVLSCSKEALQQVIAERRFADIAPSQTASYAEKVAQTKQDFFRDAM